MRKLLVIYDDSIQPNKDIKTITGEKSYGDTIYKRVTLRNRMREEILKSAMVVDVLDYKYKEQKEKFFTLLSCYQEELSVIHLYSCFALRNTKAFSVLITKAEFCNENYGVSCGEKAAMAIFPSINEYKANFDALHAGSIELEPIVSDAFMDLAVQNNFISFITGGFEARFFNALEGDEYTVTKRSNKIQKIKSEYNFYYLLPEHMKMWFVMPFKYNETADSASYTMERYHMTDIAIRFVHGAVSMEELDTILSKLFRFFITREKKQVDTQKADMIRDELYVHKLKLRMEELKQTEHYGQFNKLIASGTKYAGIDDIVARYLALYEKLKDTEDYLAVGHGDLCFSNILYNNEAQVLRLIDPKGAMQEEEIYTNPYYDLAKLSHSICGSYDFFNSGLYQIILEENMQFKLEIDTDNRACISLFKKYLLENKFAYKTVRLYEAGLFLSMLPYHMDRPGKVFAFLLNAIHILDEVERCTQE